MTLMPRINPTIERRINIRRRFDAFHGAAFVVSLDFGADVRQLDEDDVAERVLGVTRRANALFLAARGRRYPLVSLGVFPLPSRRSGGELERPRPSACARVNTMSGRQ